MSVKLYDDAFVKKLQNWTRNTNVHITSPDETSRLFEVIADETHDSPIQLPLIALSRPGGFTVLQSTKVPMSYDGITLGSALSGRSKLLNAIPISIPYQLDVYTRYQTECDAYIRNIVYNIINYPKLEIMIPYENENLIHHSNIRMEPEVSNTSAIPERLIVGQFTRMSVKINIDDAYLWDIKYRSNYDITYDLQINENN